MSNMASKFADEEDVDEDDSSSFEEVSKPAERPAAAKAQPKAEEQATTKAPVTDAGASPIKPSGTWKVCTDILLCNFY